MSIEGGRLQQPLPTDPARFGSYRVVAVLGEGGMGRVFLCVAPDGRLVTVKQLHDELADDADFRARFRREVESSRQVSGAYTAPVIDADADAQIPWFASMYVPGPSLREVLDAAGPLGEDPARLLAAGMAQALVDIHRAGLIHRDLKPANVLLAPDGVRVIDFGIARAVEGDTELTHTGALIGSPAFMSPEQADDREVTTASDIFSLGSVVVAACNGTPPFGGDSAPLALYNVVHVQPELGHVPERLRAVVEPCLNKDPAGRPSPLDVLHAVGRIAPSSRPWPESVNRLIAAQQAEVDALLSGATQPAVVPVHAAQTQAAYPVQSPTPQVAYGAASPSVASPAPSVSPEAPAHRSGMAKELVGVAIALVLLVIGGTAAWAALKEDDSPKHTQQTEQSATDQGLPASEGSAAGPAGSTPTDAIPTPGGKALASVQDKYTKGTPTCAQLEAKVKRPADLKLAGINSQVATKPEVEGGKGRCVWMNQYGDTIDTYWNYYGTGYGEGTGAEQSKKRYEMEFRMGKLDGGPPVRDSSLQYAEEAHGYFKKDQPNKNECILWARDVNVLVFIDVTGPSYPPGTCERTTKEVADGALQAMPQ